MRNNIITTLAVVIEFSSKYAKSYEVLIVGRLLIGISAGNTLRNMPIQMY